LIDKLNKLFKVYSKADTFPKTFVLFGIAREAREKERLTSNVLLTLIGGTAASVAADLIVVAKYLIPAKE
jgi:hypothetical protein